MIAVARQMAKNRTARKENNVCQPPTLLAVYGNLSALGGEPKNKSRKRKEISAV